MSKKITSFMVMLAVLLLTLPAHAQVQKQKLVSDKNATEMRVMKAGQKMTAVDVTKQLKALEAKAIEENNTAALDFVANWFWKGQTPQQVAAQTRAEQASQKSVLARMVAIADGKVETLVKSDLRVITNVQKPKLSAPKNAPASATALAGYYKWNWQQSSSLSQTPEISGTGTTNVTITATNSTALKISGLMPNDLTATYSAADGTITIAPQLAGTSSSYGNYYIYGAYYYEGDDENEAGYYLGSIVGTVGDDGVIDFGEYWFYRRLTGGSYDGYSLTPYWVAGSTLTPSEAPSVVVLPEGVELVEYAMSYNDATNGTTKSAPAAVAVDGNDVYFQGFSSYISEALVKGTKNGNKITVPADQLLGSYANMDSYLYTPITFTYDEATDTYTSTGQVYSVLGDQYYDFRGNNVVLKGVVEKAATPANPEISALTNSSYGYYIDFNVPTVDTNGDGLVTSKLSYVIYTDVEQNVNPLTFTPATHIYLTQNMTEIPYGFSENYDFYTDQIYLNELYSSSWNKIGIKSIYKGGGETHETEIQWYTIKDYAGPVESIYPPYTSDLTKESEFGKYIVIDANGDGKTWKWSASYGTYYGYSTSTGADDYLILPIELEANKNYTVSVSAASYSERYPEKFEVKVGKAATVEGLNMTAIAETTVASNVALDFDGDFTTDDEAGTWYVAIHATSDKNMWNLSIKSLKIELGAEPTAPAAPADFTAVAGEQGALEVNVALTAPATSIDGSALTGTQTVTIYRDDVEVHKFEGVAAGTALTWKDETVEDGKTYTYYAQASNASGLGAKTEKVSVWVGQDVPADVEDVQFVGMPTPNSIQLSWSPVVGVNGGYINPATVQYDITTIDWEDYMGWFQYPVEGETIGSVVGETTGTADYAGLDEGEERYEYFGVKAKVGTNESDPTSVICFTLAGAPYELPIEEHFTGSSMHYVWDYNEITALGVSQDGSDGDVALALTADGDNGMVMFESFKLNTKAAANPTLLFDAKKGTSAQDKLIVYGVAPNGTKTTLETVTLTDEYQTFKVAIPADLAKERWSKIGFNAELESGKNILLDNIKVLDLYEYDLSVAVKAPASVQAGNTATITATVKNEGENEATGYTVTVKAGEEVLVEETVNEVLAPFTTKEFTAELATTIFDDAADVTITATVEYTNDLNEDNNTAETIISVKESTAAPVTDVTATAEDNSILVGWTAPENSTEETTEDVEAYEEFDTGGLTEDNLDEHYGNIGEWTVYDGNRELGYGFNNITVPNLGKPNAWLVMNPASSQVSQDLSASHPAHSGSQYFISTCVAESEPIVDTDHWLISPELPGTAQTISFYACTITDQYGAETFEILASATDTNVESFTLVKEETTKATDWTEFTADLPAGTKYFAIRHTSNDIFGLKVDDITYTVGGGEIDYFNIYLDGELVATAPADAVTATLENVAKGDHTVAVSVVYTSGQESKPVEATVAVTTGIDSITVVTQPVDVYTIDGKLVRKQTTSFDGLKGVYIVGGKKVVLK